MVWTGAHKTLGTGLAAAVTGLCLAGVTHPLRAQTGATVQVSARVVSAAAPREGWEQAHREAIRAVRHLDGSRLRAPRRTLTASGIAEVVAERVVHSPRATVGRDPAEPPQASDHIRVTVAYVAN